MLWETTTGEIRYADANHRRGITPHLEVDACDILVTPVWTRNTQGLVNKVSIGYGVAPDDPENGAGGGEQPRYVDDSPTSVDRWGRYEFTATTELAALADAQAMGSLILARNRAPVWSLDALPVDVRDLSAADTVALLALEMHDLVLVTGLPAAGTSPTAAFLWVEGWDETLAWNTHDLTLTVTDYCRTAPPPLWDGVDPRHDMGHRPRHMGRRDLLRAATQPRPLGRRPRDVALGPDRSRHDMGHLPLRKGATP